MADFYGRYSGILGGGGGGGGGSALDVKDEGILVKSNPTFLNFVGLGVTATLNGTGVDVTIPGGGGAPFQEVPTGLVNNSNVIFMLSQAPNPPAGLELYRDGLVLVQGVDYSISGTTITMAVAPNFAQTLYAFYSVVSGGGGTVGSPYQQAPVGLINNSNVTYTVSPAPNPTAAFELYQDGLLLVQGVDYTIIGGTITMAVAPNFGQTLYAVFTVIGGAGGGVTDLNGASGSITIAPGTNISVGTVGTVVTVSAPGLTKRTVVGTVGAPTLITAAGGIAFSGAQDFTKNYIAGNGGAVIVTANPQIAAGVSDGQELTLQSTSATNTVKLQNGTGLIMNGPWIGGLGSVITFTWDTANWVEKARQ